MYERNRPEQQHNKNLAQEIAIHSDKLNVCDSWQTKRGKKSYQKMKRKTSTIFNRVHLKSVIMHIQTKRNKEMSRFICTDFFAAAVAATATLNRCKIQ